MRSIVAFPLVATTASAACVARCSSLERRCLAIDIARCGTRDVVAAAVERQREGQTTLIDHDRTDLKAADDVVHERVDVVQEGLTFAEG